MKDMKAIITRAMLAFIAFILIIIVYAFVGTSEDKGKIRKIKFVNHEKNTSTGSWKYNVIINDKIELRFTVWREMGDIYFSTMKEGDIKLIENKNNINESNIEVIYGK